MSTPEELARQEMTLTACAFTYRLIKHAGARNVLFLVNRANLGRQTLAEWSEATSTAAVIPQGERSQTHQFRQFVTPDAGRKFTEFSA